MNFDLTEERQMLQDSLRRFLSDRYTTSVRNDILESETGFSADIWGQLAELGAIGSLLPEEHGGTDGARSALATMVEAQARARGVDPSPATRHGG